LARDAKSPEELYNLRRAYLELVAEIQRLPQDEAFTLIFRFLVGMPVAEIAQVLGISEDGVRMRLGRGRRRLAERLTGKREDG
ncbi:MAG: sigma factor-like helix-turn-helix DNA-binding protein, partial [candidate division WOR-3 bacterium]